MSNFRRMIRRNTARRMGLPPGYFCKKNQEKMAKKLVSLQKQMANKYQEKEPDKESIENGEKD